MLWKRHGKTRKLGTFCPKVSAEQVELYKALYDLLLPGEEVNVADIAPTGHRLLYSTFTMHFSSRNQVDSAFEQSLIFSILSPKQGHYLSANVLQQLFSRTQRTCFSTFFHAARLGGCDVDYVMVEYAEEDNRDEEFHEDDDDGEVGSESGLADGEVDDMEDEIMEMDFRGPGEGLGDASEQAHLDTPDNTATFELTSGDHNRNDDHLEDDEDMFEIVPQSTAEDPILRCRLLYLGPWYCFPA